MEFFVLALKVLGTMGLMFAVVWIVEPRETFEGLPWPLGPREISDSPHQKGVARGHYKSLTEEEVQQRITDDHCGVWYDDEPDEFWGDDEPRYFTHELKPPIEKSKGEDGEASLCLRKVRK